MKHFFKNRVLPLFVVFSMLVPLCVIPVSAEWDSSRDVEDLDAVDELNSAFTVIAGYEIMCEYFGLSVSSTPAEFAWDMIDRVVKSSGTGEVGIDELNSIADIYTSYFNRPIGETFSQQLGAGTQDVVSNLMSLVLFGKMGLTFETRSCGSSGMTRIYCPELDLWVVTSTGRYAYVNEAYADTSGGNQWIGEVTAADRATREVAMHNLDRLNMMCNDLKENGIPAQIKNLGSNFKCIWWNRMVYANENGVPFVAWVDKNQSATSQDRPQTEVKDEVGEIVEGVLEGINTGIDLENLMLTLPDGGLQFIDQLIYDSFNQTYNIDSHDTYQIENNFYFEYNFSWTYHVTHTSITYIGQTEEYDKYYEVYYELPDGRNSADLTKEDLEQLNLSIDVVPYGRSADDTSLRSLYHFDGDTHDESYWNYCTDFVWNTGASLTYMDAGTFKGALYLDENDHNFDIMLPSDIGTGDFTLQFRYYQSYTPAPSQDSEISFGDLSFCVFTGQQFGWDSRAISVIPTGTWNEIAFMREDGILHYYLNGVCFGSIPDSRFFSYDLNFSFGSNQQTYKYFDELRVLDYALVSNGENYAPSAVPHDTNLTLVLPDSSVPVADEFWDIQTSGTNLINGNFSTGELPEDFQTAMGSFPETGNLTANTLNQFGISSTSDVTLNVLKNYTLVTQKSAYTSTGSNTQTSGKYTYSSWHGGVFTPITLTSTKRTTESYSAGYALGTDLTIAVLLNDGSVYQCTAPAGTVNSVTFDGGTIGFDRGSASTGTSPNILTTQLYFAYVAPDVGSSLEVVYVELIEGTFSDLSGEWVESVLVMEAEELNTPTLAVRTDKEITTYQIGGVRPSLPVKGQVWCLVENDRITSIQIYNGSAWEGCDGRIWTGSRWIPASSYNVITLQDMYDIADATQDFEYIYSEAGFWTWWQKSWNAFQDKLFLTLESGGTGSGDVDLDAVDPEQDPAEEDAKSFLEFLLLVVAGGKSVVSGTRELFSGVVSSVPGTMDDLTDAFDSGGVAVGIFDGSSMDPDLPYAAAAASESEVLDPWRYR